LSPVGRRPQWLQWLVAATLGVYRAAILIEEAAAETNKKKILFGAVSTLIVLLCGFKLAGALALSPSAVAAMQEEPVWRYVLPLGFSYYLFKLVSYLLEVYWDNIPAQRNLVSVGVYASFFPQIVSGAIQRPGDFFEKLTRVGHVDPEDLAHGLRRILA
jgi:alginate O-acetyltransferase complex protein AlgI